MPSDAPRLTPNDALLIVDVQRDFCPGGALPVTDGDQVVAPLNAWVGQAQQAGATIVFSRDWHPPQHCSFAPQGGPWPVHCVRDTPGADWAPGLVVPGDVHVISKGTAVETDAYSPFAAEPLVEYLQDRSVERVFVGGLAEDVCVRAAALDAIKAGFQTVLITDACRSLTPESGAQARMELGAAGGTILPAKTRPKV
jgi:nicotinamidase/pyrazinamidase